MAATDSLEEAAIVIERASFWLPDKASSEAVSCASYVRAQLQALASRIDLLYGVYATVHTHVHLAATSRYLQGSNSPFSLPQSPPTALLWQVPRSCRGRIELWLTSFDNSWRLAARRARVGPRLSRAEFPRRPGLLGSGARRGRDMIRVRFRW